MSFVFLSDVNDTGLTNEVSRVNGCVALIFPMEFFHSGHGSWKLSWHVYTWNTLFFSP